jgi:hypothetical protein
MRFASDRRLGSTACVAALVLAGGCQVYDPSLVPRDAGGQGGQCEGRRPPARPTGADGPDAEEMLFGLRDVVLDQEADALWASLGYNLDGYCTGAPDFAFACTLPEGRGRPSEDGADGIDNVFGKDLFPLVDEVVPGLEDSSRALQVAGRGLVVMRVTEWNGLADDPQVHIAITQSVDTVAAAAADPVPDVDFVDSEARLPGGELAPPPAWDGNDYTWVRSDTFLAGSFDDPLVFDANAYIADDVFVARLPDRVEILFQGIDVGVTVRVTGGIATGRISADRMRIEDVVVAGRWSVLDLLRTAESVGVCVGSTEYNFLRSRLEAIVDVSSDPMPGPGALCDAISLGVGFTGVRVRFGGVTEGPMLSNSCESPPDGGVTPPDGGTEMADAGVDSGA